MQRVTPSKVYSPLCYEDGSRIEIGSYPDQGIKESEAALEAAVRAYNSGLGQPLAEDNKTEWLKGLIKDASDHGAKILNPSGGHSYGTFFYPAVVCPVNSKMRLYKEEQFGPIVPIVPFDNPEEVFKYVLESNFGQQISIFGTGTAMIGHFIDSLSNMVSRININCQCQRGPDSFPFTGRKDSAEGTLSIVDALKVFSIRSMVAAKGTDQNKAIITEILKKQQSQFLSRDFIL